MTHPTFPANAVVLLANDKTVTVAPPNRLALRDSGVLQVLEPSARAIYTWAPAAWLSVKPAP